MMTRMMLKGLVILLALVAAPTLGLAEGDVEKGQAVYAKYCATCHGATGKGDGPGAKALNPKPPRDLTDRAYMDGLTEEYLVKVIQKGGAAVGKSPLMPPWSPALKDGDIRDVVTYVRSLAK